MWNVPKGESGTLHFPASTFVWNGTTILHYSTQKADSSLLFFCSYTRVPQKACGEMKLKDVYFGANIFQNPFHSTYSPWAFWRPLCFPRSQQRSLCVLVPVELLLAPIAPGDSCLILTTITSCWEPLWQPPQLFFLPSLFPLFLCTIPRITTDQLFHFPVAVSVKCSIP